MAHQRGALQGLVVLHAADQGLEAGVELLDALNRGELGHLAEELGSLARPRAPEAILACDCVLRRMEAQEKQMNGRVSDLLRRYRVVGFSTYGEQLNAMHVNQTMTGVAFYAPPEGTT